jgi:hypothetical protein
MRTSQEQQATTAAPQAKARRRRAKRGLLATYFRDISPRQRRFETAPEPPLPLVEPVPEAGPPTI